MWSDEQKWIIIKYSIWVEYSTVRQKKTKNNWIPRKAENNWGWKRIEANSEEK